MFLRQTIRRKDGKAHRYWSVVENRRLRGGGTAQKTLLYLGEINDSQQAGWCRAIEAVAGDKPVQLCLFPADRQPPQAVEHVQIRMDKLALKRPRQWGACWLALELWSRLRLNGPSSTMRGNGCDLRITPHENRAFLFTEVGSHRTRNAPDRPRRPPRRHAAKVDGWGSPAMQKTYTHIGRDHLREQMAKRPTLAQATATAAVPAASPAPIEHAISLERMDKAGLERLLAAVTQKLGTDKGA